MYHKKVNNHTNRFNEIKIQHIIQLFDRKNKIDSMKNLIHVKSISKLIHKYENLDLEMYSKTNTKEHE